MWPFLLEVLLVTFVKAKPGENALVEVRAVFINCEPDERDGVPSENEASRFEREELFKHSALQDCTKKIALIVKIASEPNNSGDEYIPIEHVFRGSNKRVRLLDPYVLRLRRETPLQAYKLRRMATVNGVLSDANGNTERDKKLASLKPRSKRTNDLDISESNGKHTTDCELTEKCMNSSVCLHKRDRRHEHNIVVQEKDLRGINDNDNHINKHRLNTWSSQFNENTMRPTNTEINYINVGKDTENTNNEYNDLVSSQRNNDKYGSSEKEFDMYEIGNPDLLYNVQVQLFEKLTTPDRKTVWNDVTKGEPASVSNLSPEWIGQDMNIRYRPTEWIPREAFTLPLISMCLLTPSKNLHAKTSKTEDVLRDAEKYIVVPKEDIMSVEEDGMHKRDGNYSDPDSADQNEQLQRRRVLIRTSRAIFGGREDDLNIAVSGSEEFLTMTHAQPHHAQIDLEVRADDNQLVPIGSSGRIMSVVADSSRRTRTTMNVQITNTGLAAARFRVMARDCSPAGFQNDLIGETFSDSPVLLPPRHTRRVRLDLPAEIPLDVTHCIVSLVNDEEETVAMRDITIKKGDRCFCVWHCECVCLTEDPKLVCRDMAEGRQTAAGLTLRERVRHARAVCYHDDISVNMIVTAIGVLMTLLLFGLAKACLGLFCRSIGSWGLHRLLQMPRKLDHYYEDSLQDCSVIYDDEGWPVHPCSKERTVRLVSIPIEFILNLIYFVTTPCIIIYDVVRQLYTCARNPEEASWRPCNNEKNTFGSHHDIQTSRKHRRKRRRHIKKWMTPAAEALTSNLWLQSIPDKYQTTKEPMLPLLREDITRGKKMVVQACTDSEGEDTKYVMIQMQKSKESLASNQNKLNGSY